jgi:shikimate kinase
MRAAHRGAPTTRRHVILLGLSGAGKTTVGRLTAKALGARFVDLDEDIARHARRPIAVIFERDGEAAFRVLESGCARVAFAREPAVIAVGGGFVEDDPNRAAARAAGLTVYLQVAPATAAARLGGSGGRPLLGGPDPAARLASQLERRSGGYLEAEHVVATDGTTAEEVAHRVASLAREHGGW